MEGFFLIEVTNYSSDKVSNCFSIMPDFFEIGWWIRDHEIKSMKDYLMMTVRMTSCDVNMRFMRKEDTVVLINEVE